MPKILLAEDDKILAELSMEALEKSGYEVAICTNGEEAVEKVQAEAFDLILMDLMMPIMDGFEAVRRIREMKSLPFIPIIVLSSHDNAEAIKRSMELGADEFMSKPFDMVTSTARISAMLRLKKTHDALREAEERWENIVQSIPENMRMIDRDMNVVWTNEIVRKNFDEAVIGEKCYKMFHRRKELCESQPCGTLKTFADGKIHEHEMQVRYKDGTTRDIRCMSSVASRDAKGAPVTVLEISRDITGYRKAAARIERVIRKNSDGILVSSREGVVLFANPAAEKLMGHKADELTGELSNFPVTAGDTTEISLTRSSGEEVTVEMRVAEIEWRGEMAYLSSLRDITKRKQAEKKLKKSNEELKKALDQLKKADTLLIRQEKLASIGTLSAGVCHEILNPLNIIGTIVQVMQTEDLPEEVKENHNEIMTQVKRATRITNNLRVFAHRKEPEVKPVDIHALFDKTASFLEHDLTLNNIKIEKNYQKELPLVQGDEDQLAQVFLNLLTNARDAMKKKGGTITLRTVRSDEGIEIRFSDTGPGISRDIIGKIFDPFFSTKDPGQGTGLGLSILHSIIENHKGDIGVESEEGKGTTFVITLSVREKAKKD